MLRLSGLISRASHPVKLRHSVYRSTSARSRRGEKGSRFPEGLLTANPPLSSRRGVHVVPRAESTRR